MGMHIDDRMRYSSKEDSKVLFGITGKESPLKKAFTRDEELALWGLMTSVESKVGMEPVNVHTVLVKVTGKMGLTSKETLEALRKGVKAGYFEEVRIK